MFEEGLRRECPRAELEAALGTSATLLDAPDARIPLPAYYALVEVVARRAADPWFGLTYATSRRSSDGLDAIGLLVLSSRTLGHALERLVRFQAFLRTGERYRLDVEDDAAVFRFEPWGPPRPAHAHVAMICAVDVLAAPRVLCDASLAPRWCRFRAAPSGELDAATRALGVRPALGAHEDAFALPRAALALAMPRADAAFATFFERYLEARTPTATPTTRDDVERHLRTRLADRDASLAGTARALGASARTLQRRLADEGTTYDRVVDELRRDHARAHLRAGTSCRETAYLVGFADASAFARAVRRWEGRTPAGWATALHPQIAPATKAATRSTAAASGEPAAGSSSTATRTRK